MARMLTTLVALFALLTASGCMALQCQESWAVNRFSGVPPSSVTSLPQEWFPPQPVLPPLQFVLVVEEMPPILRLLPQVASAETADPVSFTSRTASTAPTPSTTVKLYYGTNRPTPNTTASPMGNHYGQCEVSIPQRHQFGQLERPSFWRLEFRESQARHVILQHVQPLAADQCLEQLRGDLAVDEEATLFVFVHGYNVDFPEAAQRTAQMAFDLQFRGVPLFYSWPSRGVLTGYGDDQRSADASAGPLAEFLTRVATETGARRIHLVAHSLGNRALVGALARLGQTSNGSVRFHQVVFAAPDLDAGQFANDIAPRIRPVVERVTIYSSGSDLALWASRLWNRAVRLGQPGTYWTKIRTYDWIDVIDATAVGFEWFELGHSAYGGELLADLQRVLDGQPAGVPPTGPEAGRWTVTRPPAPHGPYGGCVPQTIWRFTPAGPWPAAPVDRWR